MIVWLWSLGVSCRTEDPDLRAKRDAVEDFAKARAKLEAGDAAGARAGFAAMAAVHPIVDAWEASAAAAAGDLEGAIAILDGLIAERPDLAVVRYNRAAYLARMGQPERAGPELEVAIELGAASVHEAMADPDFAPHLEHPALGFLIRNALIVAVESPPTSTFLGSEIRLTLRVTGAQGVPISVEGPSARGPVSFVEHVESLADPREGGVRKLTWAWQVEGAGAVVLDPLVVTAGPVTTEVVGATVQAAAPPDRGDPTPRPIPFPVASAVAKGLEAGSARWNDGRLQVMIAGDERLNRVPSGPPPRRYTYREGGVTKWVLESHGDNPPIASMTRTTGPRTKVPVAIPTRPSAGGPAIGD